MAKEGEALADPRTSGTELRWSEDLVRDLLEAAPDAMLAVDVEGRIVLVNRQLERMFGWTRDELLGHCVEALLPESHRKEHVQKREDYLRAPKTRAMGEGKVLFGLHRDGRLLPVEISLSPLREAGGLVVSSVRDASGRWQGEQVLRDELGEWRLFAESLLDAAPGIVLLLDHDGRVVRYNSFLERLSGRKADEHRGADWFDSFLPAREHERIKTVFQQTLAGRITTGTTNAILDSRGVEHVVRWTNRRLEDAQGRVRGVLSIGLDITDSFRAEQENRTLRQSLQAQGRLVELGTVAAKLAHDVGNAVAGLSLQAQLVERYAEREDRRAQLVEAAHDTRHAVQRLEEMVGELKEFTREQRLRRSTVKVSELVKTLVKLWQPVAEEQGIEVRAEPAAELPELSADIPKLQRVLDNLLSNAVEAIGTGPGAVRVVTRADGGNLLIEVSDDGPGVPEGVDIFRLFETTKPQGTGLGLPVCREIVQAHGGSIEFERRTEGGTTFRVSLPFAAAE